MVELAIILFCLPVFNNEWEEVGHAGGPQAAERVVVEAGVQVDNLTDVVGGDGQATVAARACQKKFSIFSHKL